MPTKQIPILDKNQWIMWQVWGMQTSSRHLRIMVTHHRNYCSDSRATLHILESWLLTTEITAGTLEPLLASKNHGYSLQKLLQGLQSHP